MFRFASRKKSTITAYCSWCFQQTDHNRVQLNFLRRAVFCCSECQRRTVHCRLCTNMARGYPPLGHLPRYDDELCFKHKGLVQNWKDDDIVDDLVFVGRCSHCRDVTEHQYIRKSATGPIIYCCTNPQCQSLTLQCSSSDCNSMAPMSTFLRNQCHMCSGAITDWSEPLPKHRYFCSHCFSESTHVEVSEKSLRCSSCYNFTSTCNSCPSGASKVPGLFSKSKCLSCDEGIPWIRIQSDMALFEPHLNDFSLSDCKQLFTDRLDQHQSELLPGFKVPQLIIASMSGTQRIQLACTLSLSWKEAHELETGNVLSLEITRRLESLSRETHELLPFTGDTNWFKLLKRCLILLFGNCVTESPSNSSLISDVIESAELKQIENEFLERMAKFQRYRFSRQLMGEIDSIVDNETLSSLHSKLLKSGYTQTSARYITDGLSVAMYLTGAVLPL
ncbi:hypothetical protein GEMRC1_002193 [Eukaryota sp. GEM-RC1]